MNNLFAVFWRSCAAVCAALLFVCFQPPQAFADGFPGIGSQSDWSDALPYYNQGNKLLQSQRYEDAVRRYKEAISYYHDDPDFFVNLGVSYRKLGNFPDAEEAFKSAIKLNEKDWMPWSDLANVYLKQDKLQEAVKTFERTLKCGPPAAEKAAIQQDIKDITKILSMQQPLAPKTTAATKTPTTRKTTATKPTAASHSTAPRANAEGNVNLQGTGWDYVYPGTH